MKNLLKLQVLSIITLIIPVNIYVIGDYLGAGIQFPLLRYQITYMGSFIVTVFRDLNYIMNGTFSSRTSISVVIWVSGVIFLVIGIIRIWTKSRENNNPVKTAGILVTLSALLFLCSIILQVRSLVPWSRWHCDPDRASRAVRNWGLDVYGGAKGGDPGRGGKGAGDC